MIAGWVVYVLFVSALLWIAALAAERCLQWMMMPTRWAWAGALAGTIVVPLVAARWANPVAASAGAVISSPAPVAPGPVGTVAGQMAALWQTVPSRLQGLDPALAILWGAGSVTVALALFVAYRRLTVDRRQWERRTIDGQPVRVSSDVGPAVVGIARTEVVLPRWVLGARSERRRIILLHEIEHLRAGDARLLFLGLAVAILMPWNVFAWTQLRRLRLAVEFDCDERVLRRGIPVREYANILFDASLDGRTGQRLATAFVQFDSQLGRRIRKMTEKRHTRHYVRAMMAACTAAAVVFVACETPTPTEASLDGDVPQTIRLDKPAGEMTARDKEAVHAELRAIDESVGEGQHVIIESADGNTWKVDPNNNVMFGDPEALEDFKKKLHNEFTEQELDGQFVHREGADGHLEVVDLESGDVSKFRVKAPAGELRLQGENEFHFREQSGTLQSVELKELRAEKQSGELRKVKEGDAAQF